MISADIPVLVASLGGIVTGFCWRTYTKRAIQALMASTVAVIAALIYIQYTSNVVGSSLPFLGELVLQSVGLFFYTWGTWNAGKWLGGIYLKVRKNGYLQEK